MADGTIITFYKLWKHGAFIGQLGFVFLQTQPSAEQEQEATNVHFLHFLHKTSKLITFYKLGKQSAFIGQLGFYLYFKPFCIYILFVQVSKVLMV